MLALIYPTFNELHPGHYLKKNIKLFHSHKDKDIEILFVDGGSTDGTLEFLKHHHFTPLSCPHTSRAERLQMGIEKTHAPMILFHHPRSHLSLKALKALEQIAHENRQCWGGFYHEFDSKHLLLKYTSWYANHIRSRRNILYLDHCLFSHRSLMEKIGGFPLYDIFEDTHLCLKLRKLSPAVLLAFTAQTSSIRYQKNGLFFQTLMNMALKGGHYLGIEDKKMNRFYERGLELNQKYF